MVVVKLESKGKLGLELLPDDMVLLLLDSAVTHQDMFPHVGIEVRGILPVLPQLIDLDVSWLVHSSLGHLEQVFFLVEVDIVVIQDFLNQEVNLHSCCDVNVMNSWLGHDVQTVVQTRPLQSWNLGVPVAKSHGRIIRENALSQCGEFPFRQELLLLELYLVGKMQLVGESNQHFSILVKAINVDFYRVQNSYYNQNSFKLTDLPFNNFFDVVITIKDSVLVEFLLLVDKVAEFLA